METIEIKTLIDITNSGVARHKLGLDKEHSQYKNWITLLQCIGLRAIIEYDQDPQVDEVDVKSVGFGTKYKGKHNVWTFRFTTDRSTSYEDETGKLGLLINDLHQVPVIEKLEETINISKAVFELRDNGWCNTLISSVDIDPRNTNV